MYKKHKWLSGLRSFYAFNQLRQICDLTGWSWDGLEHSCFVRWKSLYFYRLVSCFSVISACA